MTTIRHGVKMRCYNRVKGLIVDGRVPHSILLEIFTDKGIGTEIVK
jgi:acetylglutamate kinase